MKPPLPEKECYDLLEKHGIPITGYIPLENLFALIRESNRLGAEDMLLRSWKLWYTIWH
ncbi:hypothetical protein UFOVP1155_40 [uncultured Caudovirales phage]|uniref:Uncharacterized protein n=1 Tax=uncultured Caudovirales phage TaxID=2100421 RepID=A0A6J5QSP8_9CAUD|nr:hypothetical protein UFOVP1155_40 [uncultured Caudovirales phage]